MGESCAAAGQHKPHKLLSLRRRTFVTVVDHRLRLSQRVFVAHHDQELLCSCHGSVHELAAERKVAVAGVERQHNHRVLAALRLVDGDGVGQGQILELLLGVVDVLRLGLAAILDCESIARRLVMRGEAKGGV